MTDLASMLQAVDAGGSAAMLVCVYFIFKCESRLARIEKALDKVLEKPE
jgi:hypothetical protein